MPDLIIDSGTYDEEHFIAHHLLKEQECLDLSELADQRFILLNKDPDLHNRSTKQIHGEIH